MKNNFIIINDFEIGFSLIETNQGWEINAPINRQSKMIDFCRKFCVKSNLRDSIDTTQFFNKSECALIIKYFRVNGFEVKQVNTELSKDLEAPLGLLLPEITSEEIKVLIDLLSYPDQLRLATKLVQNL